MRIFLALAASISFGVCLAAGPAEAMNARELLASCDVALRSMSGSRSDVSIAAEGRACWTYMEAVQDMVALADEGGHRLLNVCVPESGRTDGLVRAFTKYAHAHPDQLNSRPSVVVLQALWDVFPCK